MSHPVLLDEFSSGEMEKRYAPFFPEADVFSASESLVVLNPMQIIPLLPQLLAQPRRKIQQRSVRWIRLSEQSEEHPFKN